ncbi:unnamed protein product, partial [Fusarium graminearum]
MSINSSSTEQPPPELLDKPGIEKTTTTTQWHLAPELQNMRDRDEEIGQKPRKLGVTWQNLTVKGVGSDAAFNENVVSQFYPFHSTAKDAPIKTIIDGSHGCVKP